MFSRPVQESDTVEMRELVQLLESMQKILPEMDDKGQIGKLLEISKLIVDFDETHVKSKEEPKAESGDEINFDDIFRRLAKDLGEDDVGPFALDCDCDRCNPDQHEHELDVPEFTRYVIDELDKRGCDHQSLAFNMSPFSVEFRGTSRQVAKGMVHVPGILKNYMKGKPPNEVLDIDWEWIRTDA